MGAGNSAGNSARNSAGNSIVRHFNPLEIKRWGRPYFPTGEERSLNDLSFDDLFFPTNARLMGILVNFEPKSNRESFRVDPKRPVNGQGPSWAELNASYWAGWQVAHDLTEQENFVYACQSTFDRLHLYFLAEPHLKDCRNTKSRYPLTDHRLNGSDDEALEDAIAAEVQKGGVVLSSRKAQHAEANGQRDIHVPDPREKHYLEKCGTCARPSEVRDAIERFLDLRRRNVESGAHVISCFSPLSDGGLIRHTTAHGQEDSAVGDAEVFAITSEEIARALLERYASYIKIPPENLPKPPNEMTARTEAWSANWNAKVQEQLRARRQEDPLEFIRDYRPVILGVPLMVSEGPDQ